MINSNVEEWFEVLNVCLFDGVLSKPIFVIEEMDTEVGYCVEENGEIYLGLDNHFDSYTEFIFTFCHELCHLEQYQILKEEPNHGKSFKKRQKEFRKLGIII